MLKKFTTDFTVTPNEVINHPKMSLKAKGIWTFLNSKPQNWKFSVSRIAKQNKDGDDGITTGLKELEKHRYLKRVPVKDDTGQWNGFDYHLFDQPFPITVPGKTGNGKTGDGKTGDGKSPNLSKTINSKKDSRKKDETKSLFGNNDVPDLPTEILKYLNEQRGKSMEGTKGFEFIRSNFADIKARIKEKKYKIDDFKMVIDFKIRKWKDDSKMKTYIRPSTLFGNKFDQYLVEAKSEKPTNDGSNNFEFNPSQTAEMK